MRVWLKMGSLPGFLCHTSLWIPCIFDFLKYPFLKGIGNKQSIFFLPPQGGVARMPISAENEWVAWSLVAANKVGEAIKHTTEHSR